MVFLVEPHPLLCPHPVLLLSPWADIHKPVISNPTVTLAKKTEERPFSDTYDNLSSLRVAPLLLGVSHLGESLAGHSFIYSSLAVRVPMYGC